MARRKVLEDLNASADIEDPREDSREELGPEDDNDAPEDSDDEDEEELEAADGSDEGDEGEDEDEGDGEDGEDEGDGDDEGDEEPEPRRGQSRGRRQYADLRRSRREAVERARQLELEIAELRRAGGGSRGNEPDPVAVRNARLAAMEPEERTQYMINELAQNFQGQLNAQAFRDQDARDRDAYNERAKKDKSYRLHREEVEHRLAVLRKQGQNVPRETILKFLLGERVLQGRGSKMAKKQRTEAARRVGNERVRPVNSRGERGGSRGGSKSAALEERLKNVPI